MSFRQLKLEFGWLPTSSAMDEELAHLSAASETIEIPEEEVVSVRLLGSLGQKPRSKPPREGTQASHSFARVKAVASGEATGKMPPDFNGSGLAIPDPTEHLPGSDEKIEVLRDRATARQMLFHPRDALPDKR